MEKKLVLSIYQQPLTSHRSNIFNECILIKKREEIYLKHIDGVGQKKRLTEEVKKEERKEEKRNLKR